MTCVRGRQFTAQEEILHEARWRHCEEWTADLKGDFLKRLLNAFLEKNSQMIGAYKIFERAIRSEFKSCSEVFVGFQLSGNLAS